MFVTGTQRIVFGDDGGEASDRAWRWLAAHQWPEWTIDGLTADPDPSHMQWGQPPQPVEWEPAWRRNPADIGSAGVRHFRAAADPRVLLSEADADLLVIGIRERGGARARLVGSTAEWLLHHPPSPLAIVRRTETVKDVLVCADGSPHSLRAVETFLSLPLAASCEVTVLTVSDGRVESGVADSVAREITEKVAAVDSLERRGQPTDVILETAADIACDLIVMGTRGLTGWKRLRLGSTASAVVHADGRDHLLACVD